MGRQTRSRNEIERLIAEGDYHNAMNVSAFYVLGFCLHYFFLIPTAGDWAKAITLKDFTDDAERGQFNGFLVRALEEAMGLDLEEARFVAEYLMAYIDKHEDHAHRIAWTEYAMRCPLGVEGDDSTCLVVLEGEIPQPREMVEMRVNLVLPAILESFWAGAGITEGALTRDLPPRSPKPEEGKEPVKTVADRIRGIYMGYAKDALMASLGMDADTAWKCATNTASFLDKVKGDERVAKIESAKAFRSVLGAFGEVPLFKGKIKRLVFPPKKSAPRPSRRDAAKALLPSSGPRTLGEAIPAGDSIAERLRDATAEGDRPALVQRAPRSRPGSGNS